MFKLTKPGLGDPLPVFWKILGGSGGESKVGFSTKLVFEFVSCYNRLFCGVSWLLVMTVADLSLAIDVLSSLFSSSMLIIFLSVVVSFSSKYYIIF